MTRATFKIERRSLTRGNPETILLDEEARSGYRAEGDPRRDTTREAVIRAFHEHARATSYPDAGALAAALARAHHDVSIGQGGKTARAAGDALFASEVA